MALAGLLAWPSGADTGVAVDPVATLDPPARATREVTTQGFAPGSSVHPPDDRSVPVTLDDLSVRESLWPYQVALVRAWKPAGHAGEFGWGKGTLGVVLRIERGNRMRVDFGRFGIQEVPAEATDVVERANRVRVGEIEKLGPNLAVALNHRLLDPRGRTLAPAPEDLFVVPKRLFLLVFADPADPRFEAIARATAGFEERSEAALVLISSKDHVDAHVYKYAFDAGWRGMFLMDRFATAYLADYHEPSVPLPAIQLMTPEGRVLFAASWSDDVMPRLEAVAGQEIVSRDAAASHVR